MPATCSARRLSALILLALGLVAGQARAAPLQFGADPERIPTNASVNGTDRGELYTWRDESGFWVAIEDLERLGVPVEGAETRDISGRRHARLETIDGVVARFDEAALTLAIDVEPQRLAPQQFNLARVEDLPITAFTGVSGFLNAGVSGDWSGGSSTYEGRLLGNIAAGGWLARSEHQVTRADGTTTWYRLQTFAQRDWSGPMLRLLLGDFDTSAGMFSRAVSLAGISFGTAFDLRPGFVSAPTARIAGIASTATTAEIYVDNVLVATRQIRPGPYDFNNLQDFSGLRNVDVVLRDASGVRERIRIPFYFTERLLKAGLTDFNVSYGARREQAFADSYGEGMFSGHWSYGVTDDLTIGVQGQQTTGFTFLGIATAVQLGSFGVLGANLVSQRTGDGGTTHAGFAGWNYTRGPTTFRFNVTGYESGFQKVEGAPSPLTPQLKREANAGWDQSFGRHLLVSLSATDRRFFGVAAPEREYSANLSIPLFGRGDLTLIALQRRAADRRVTEGAVSFSYSWGDRYRANAGWRRDAEGGDTYYAALGRSEPQGEGYGWRAQAQETPGARDASGDLVWRARHGIVSVSGRRATFDEGPAASGTRASADAALACVGSACYVTRPVTDAFAVVDLNGVEGVRVTRNNEMIGRTDANGRVVIASLPALTRNAVEIADEDVPISIAVLTNERVLVPAQGVGYRVRFDLERISSVTGRILRGDAPLENLEFVLRAPGSAAQHLRTGRDGRFEIDQASAGRLQVQVELEDGICNAWIEVPGGRAAGEYKAGDVRCEMVASF